MGRQRRTATKVPEVTVYFWVVKVLTTGMGEATSDYFVHRVGPMDIPRLVTFAAITGVALSLSLATQLSATRYVAWVYWLAVAMVSVFGTIAADGLHVGLGTPYLASTTFSAIVLAALFVAWNASEKTLSIHSIYTRRRELFYWAVVLVTFALGTAAGDMTAITLHLGYLSSGLLFCALIAAPAIGYRWFGLNGVFAFWFAYVVTRPLGASFADWMAVPAKRGGLGFGYGLVSVSLTLLIVLLVAYLSVSRVDVPRSGVTRPAARGEARVDPPPFAAG